MAARKPAARNQRFTRFTQPKPCRICGKLTTWSDVHGNCGLDLCEKCFDAATLENAHLDGYHAPDQEGPNAKCPHCQK